MNECVWVWVDVGACTCVLNTGNVVQFTSVYIPFTLYPKIACDVFFLKHHLV